MIINVITMGMHHKVKKNMEKSFKKCNISYVFDKNISDTDYIYSPGKYIDPRKYPNKKFIFGPSFNFSKQYDFKNTTNALYLQPSQQSIDIRKSLGFNDLPFVAYPVGIDTEEFKPSKCEKNIVFIYYKDRDPNLLIFMKQMLKEMHIEFVIITYGKYKEEEYKKILNKSKYGIWIGRQESQGIALQEALSFNVPLLVWNVSKRGDEYPLPKEKEQVSEMFATTIPYWDDRCGRVFYNKLDFKNIFNKFLNELKEFKPRNFILEELNLEKQGYTFAKLYLKIK